MESALKMARQYFVEIGQPQRRLFIARKQSFHGNTRPAQRDVTPEAMESACQKMLPGFGEEMRRASLAAGVPTAILSRQSAGIAGRSLVVNLPGKPASIRVCLDAVFPAIPYCIDLIGGPYLEGNPEVVQVFRPRPS
jgi:molybdopterin adenylyltransferase